MDLHEAIRKARIELKLTQKQLADLAGIERKQLSTLERGGNVTLATVRKVVAHLPNMQPFTFGQVFDTVAPAMPRKQQEEMVRKVMVAYGVALEQMMTILVSGKLPNEDDYKRFEDAHRAFQKSIGLTDEEYDRGQAETRAQNEGKRLTRAEAAETIALIQASIAKLSLNALRAAEDNDVFPPDDEPPTDR
jgi:Predicted transcriptional regulator with C-terminal CBS domains